MFKTVGKVTDRVFSEIEITYTTVVHSAQVRLGLTTAEIKTSIDITKKVSTKIDFTNYFTLGKNNQPAIKSPFVITNQTTVKPSTEIEVQGNIRGVDVSVSNNTSVDVNKTIITNTTEAVIGSKGSGIFVSNEIESNGKAKIDIGLKGKVESPKFLNVTKISITGKAGVTLYEK